MGVYTHIFQELIEGKCVYPTWNVTGWINYLWQKPALCGSSSKNHQFYFFFPQICQPVLNLILMSFLCAEDHSGSAAPIQIQMWVREGAGLQQQEQGSGIVVTLWQINGLINRKCATSSKEEFKTFWSWPHFCSWEPRNCTKGTFNSTGLTHLCKVQLVTKSHQETILAPVLTYVW